MVNFLLGLSLGGLSLLIYRMHLLKTLKQATQKPFSESSLPSELGSPADRLGYSSLSVTTQLLRSLDFLHDRNHFLENQLADWRSIINIAPIGYLQVDEDNQLIWSNVPALNLLDIRDYDMNEPRLLLEVVRSYDLDSLIDQARSTGKPCQREWNHYPISVEVANVRIPTTHPLRGYALPLQDGRQIGVILESRAEAQNLSQQRDRWTSDVAHELKTPLTSIRLVAETLQSRLDPPLRTWIDRLLKEVIRLSTLVQEILDLSHLETAGTRPLKLNSINLPDLIQSTWMSLEPIASSKHITFTYQGPDHLYLQAEEARIYRVLLNLLDNSIKYTLPERPILLQLSLIQDGERNSAQKYTSPNLLHKDISQDTAQQETNQQPPAPIVQIDLIDGGTGFPEDDLPFIFERFYRADPSRARTPEPYFTQQPNESNVPYTPKNLSQETVRQPLQSFQSSIGSGLGLAIVHQIIELHKGSITARNHPEGGAWIQIRLPQRHDT